MSSADKKEPMPIHDDRVASQDLVIEDILTRKQVGIRKYGTGLKPLNARDNLMDAYQEALDLVVYLRNEIHRRELFEEKLKKVVAIIDAFKSDDMQMWLSLEDTILIRELVQDVLKGTDVATSLEKELKTHFSEGPK